MHYTKNKARNKIGIFMNFYIMQELRLWNLRTWRTERDMVIEFAKR